MDDAKKNSVLVVDDETSNILALTHILASEYTVYAAKSGQNALLAADKYLPDVILLDIVMPEMDGYAVLSALRNSERTQNIPAIFISGLSDAADEEKGLSLGAADYISKPFSSAIVRLRVRNQIKIINQTRLIIEKETAEKSSRSRSEFLSRMSHEMRTPMNAIMGMTALAKNTTEAKKRDDMLDKINTASGHLLKLIDDVLDMSDIEDNKLRLLPSEFSFAVLIRDILNKTNPDIKKKQQSLSAKIDPSIPDALVGDERRLGQVIMNLLSNACKFTPEQGLIQIDAFARGLENETLILQIEISDNGIGIAEEQKEKLFVPFEQADGGIDRKFGGAGLGLAISRHIVALMGGEIWVESEPAKGSKFAFTARLRLKALEKNAAAPVSLSGKTVLLVEDMEINCEIVMAMLSETGLIIECAGDGRQALDMYASDPKKYGAILMDINMPEMDGVEATRRIRALEAPEGKSVPIIAMTANVLMSEVETYLAAGMTDHIGKPVDFDKLQNKLQRYLE
ncbi:MAG: response regulator [Oscillospiraceae bacterium]|nr:response regulator [Oscillospiraceae bacterium]